MKPKMALIVCIIFTLNVSAQTFPDCRRSNFNDVPVAIFNLVNVGNSRISLNVNLLTLSAYLGNYNSHFSIQELKGSYDRESIQSTVYGNHPTPFKGHILADVADSMMISTGKKSGEALAFPLTGISNKTGIERISENIVISPIHRLFRFIVTIFECKSLKDVIANVPLGYIGTKIILLDLLPANCSCGTKMHLLMVFNIDQFILHKNRAYNSQAYQLAASFHGNVMPVEKIVIYGLEQVVPSERPVHLNDTLKTYRFSI